MKNLWNHSSIFFFLWLDVFAMVGMTRCSHAIWLLAQDLIQKINSNTMGVHILQQSRNLVLLHNPTQWFCNSLNQFCRLKMLMLALENIFMKSCEQWMSNSTRALQLRLLAPALGAEPHRAASWLVQLSHFGVKSLALSTPLRMKREKIFFYFHVLCKYMYK